MRVLLLLLAAIVAAGALSATNSEQREIADLYRRGLAGDAAAVDLCIQKLEAVLKNDPADQLARVYLGSAFTLRSRDLGFGPKKLQALKQGLALMDEAIAAAPTASKVRLARALTTSALPRIFGRAGQSRKDFEQLVQAAEQSPTRFEIGDLQTIFYHAGLAARDAGDKVRAQTLWKQGLRHPADPAIARKLEDELAKAK